MALGVRPATGQERLRADPCASGHLVYSDNGTSSQGGKIQVSGWSQPGGPGILGRGQGQDETPVGSVCSHSPGRQSPRLRATVQVWQAVPTAPPVLPSQPSSEAPSSRKPSQTTSPRLLSSQPDCHILANTCVRVGVPAPPISHCPQLLSSRADTRTRSSCRRGRPGAVRCPPTAHSSGRPEPQRLGQPLERLHTIQKRVPVARVTYCSMVDSTLKMRQTRTMRKLWGGRTRRSAPGASPPALPPPTQAGPGAEGFPTTPAPQDQAPSAPATPPPGPRAHPPRSRCTERGAAGQPWRTSSDPCDSRTDLTAWHQGATLTGHVLCGSLNGTPQRQIRKKTGGHQGPEARRMPPASLDVTGPTPQPSSCLGERQVWGSHPGGPGAPCTLSAGPQKLDSRAHSVAAHTDVEKVPSPTPTRPPCAHQEAPCISPHWLSPNFSGHTLPPSSSGQNPPPMPPSP